MADPIIGQQPADGLTALLQGGQGGILGLLQNAIGGSVDQNTTGTSNTTGSQQTNNQSQNNSNQTQQQQSTGTTTGSTTGNTTNNSTQTTQNNADVSALQQVFQQQQAGITPDMLAAIFAEGSKAAPGLVTATANAVGARSSNNTPLATALGNLSAQLTSKAAELSLAQRNASANTAAQIAQATGGTTTTGSNTQTQQQTSQQTQLQDLINQLTGQQTQNQTGSTTSNSSTQDSKNVQQDSSPNYGNVSQGLGGLLGATLLNRLIPGGIVGGANNGMNQLVALIRSLQGLGSGDTSGVGSDGVTLPGYGGTDVSLPGGQLTGDPLAGGGQLTLDDLLGPGGLDALQNGNMAGFFQQIGVDPNTLDFAGAGQAAGADPNWWTTEGWDNYDWGEFDNGGTG